MSQVQLNDVLQEIRQVLEKGDLQAAIALIEKLRPADQADLVAELDDRDQVAVLTELEPSDSADLLEEMDDLAAAAVAELLEPDQLANILNEMETDEAADVLLDLDEDQASETIEMMEEPKEILNLMKYAKDTAGGIMTVAAITLKPHWTVERALEELRTINRTDSSHYLYVVDVDGTLLGVVGLRQIVTEATQTRIAYIMETRITSVLDTTDQEECARTLARYSFLVLPVVDKNNKFLGVITADDLIEVTEFEATEDMYKMVGIAGEERISGTALDSIVKRLPWLAINMATLFVAITVIDLFETVIAGMIVIAVFLPLVSGEGGNAGSQTATVIVRGLAVGEMNLRDGKRVLLKELTVTVVNGALIGFGTGIVVYAWKGEIIIAIAIFLAMICNFVMAAVTGVLVPLGLMKMKVDPAIASAAFVTAFTDTFGFLFFLGIVAILI